MAGERALSIFKEDLSGSIEVRALPRTRARERRRVRLN
jgi:hypothetical protein